MKLKNLTKRELADLEMLCLTVQDEVERAVSKLRDENFRFYSLPKNELYRLLRLRVWETRYQVDLFYIIAKLLPFWEKWIPKRSKSLRTKGLGVRIATLTGKKSEQMLQAAIEQDFPSGQNITLRRNWKQTVLLEKEMEEGVEDGIKVKSEDKNLFDFRRPAGYLQYYQRKIKRQRAKRDRIIQEFKKRPFRRNPFV